MTLLATVAMIALTSSAQGPNYHDPKALPEERAADTYSVYEMALPAYGGDQYYIIDRAIRPNSGWRGRIEGCLHPPDELRGKVKEMLHDLELQADAYTLEPRMQLTKPYHFQNVRRAREMMRKGVLTSERVKQHLENPNPPKTRTELSVETYVDPVHPAERRYIQEHGLPNFSLLLDKSLNELFPE